MNEVLRQEKKFLIDQVQLYRYSRGLAQFLTEDPHNKGDGYPIRSLYFDSLDDRDLQEKLDGVELRRTLTGFKYIGEQTTPPCSPIRSPSPRNATPLCVPTATARGS